MDKLRDLLNNNALTEEQQKELDNFVFTWKDELNKRKNFLDSVRSIQEAPKVLWPIFYNKTPEVLHIKEQWPEIKGKTKLLMQDNAVAQAAYESFFTHAKLWDVKSDSEKIHISLWTHSRFFDIPDTEITKWFYFLEKAMSDYTKKKVSFELARSNSKGIYDLSYFYVSEGTKNAFEEIQNLVNPNRSRSHKIIYLQGPTASGKTELLRCLFHHCIKDNNISVAFTTFEDLYSTLFMDARLNNNTNLTFCKNLASTLDILLIDGIGENIEISKNGIMDKMLALFKYCNENRISIVFTGNSLNENFYLKDSLKKWLCDNATCIDMEPVLTTLFGETYNVFHIIRTLEAYKRFNDNQKNTTEY